MMNRRMGLVALYGFTAACATGCGGDDYAAPAPLAAAAPPPPAPPTGPSGLTQLQDFPTLGFAYRYTMNSDFSDPQGPAAPDPAETIGFSYQAADQTYESEIPELPHGRLTRLQAAARTFSNHTLSTAPTGTFGVSLYLPNPENGELQLSFTSMGFWNDPISVPLPLIRRTMHVGWFAYGVPTAQGDVPLAGTRTYKAVAYAGTNVVDGSPTFSGGEPGFIKGPAKLTFDFASGLLPADSYLEPGLDDATGAYADLGIYHLQEIVYAAGGTTFSGKFALPGGGIGGFFEGAFTGPGAAELMMRWQAPFIDPLLKTQGTMYGVCVGKIAEGV